MMYCTRPAIGILMILTLTPAILAQDRLLPPPLPLSEIRAALEEVQIPFERVERMHRERTGGAPTWEYHLGSFDGRLVWLIDTIGIGMISVDRYDAKTAKRLPAQARPLKDRSEESWSNQISYYFKHGTGWIGEARIKVEHDLPGCQIFYVLGDLLDNDGDDPIVNPYEIIIDALYEDEFVRTVFESNGDILEMISRGPVPEDYSSGGDGPELIR